MRIMVIYSWGRNAFLGVHVSRALRCLGHEVVERSSSHIQDIPGGYDLYLRVDDGRWSDPLPDYARPSAFWGVYLNVYPDRALKIASAYDRVYLAQLQFVQWYKERGVSAIWLPLAADPVVHREVEGRHQEYDVVFVGDPGRGGSRVESVWRTKRQTWLYEVSQAFPRSYLGHVAEGETIASVYSSGTVGLNEHSLGEVNMRDFEIPACGRPAVGDFSLDNGMDRLMLVGGECILANTVGEAIASIQLLLSDRNLARQIGARARLRVLKDHTYLERAVFILEDMFGVIDRDEIRKVVVSTDSYWRGCDIHPDVLLSADIQELPGYYGDLETSPTKDCAVCRKEGGEVRKGKLVKGYKWHPPSKSYRLYRGYVCREHLTEHFSTYQYLRK